MSITTINPADNKIIKKYECFDNKKLNLVLEENYDQYLQWRETDFKTRTNLFKHLVKVLDKNKNYYAELINQEMGKPIDQGVAEIEKCQWVCDYYADNAEFFLKNKNIKSNFTSSFVSYQPLGPILAIMPWNFPFWQVFRFAAPTLMAGNTGLLKHASNTMGCAIEIEKSFLEAGFPENVFNNLIIKSNQVENIINNKIIQAVTLTGSTQAGQAVAEIAGRNLKKCVLELGGSDPYIILSDADLDLAVDACVTSRLNNTGQSCVAAKRFIVDKKIVNQFTAKFVTKMAEYNNKLGPLARIDLRDELDNIVQESIKLGAVCELGGKTPNNPGAFYPPTVLTNIQTTMPAFTQELFGPVAAIISAENTNHAIELANQSEFGLGGAVFSTNLDLARDIAINKIQAGYCAVNTLVKSDPRLPFGGIKKSGYGRELGQFGIHEFVNIKTVCEV